MTGYLRTLWLFYRRHLRVQPLRELMALAGVAAGVALLFAVQVAHRSVTGSFEDIAHGVAGDATLELAARGDKGFDQKVSEDVEKMPGVEAAAPLLSEQIVALGPKGRRELTLVGATEQVIPLHGALSSQFQRASEASHKGLLLLTEPTARAIGVKPGEAVTVLVGGRTERMTLNAALGSDRIGVAADSPIAAAPLAIAQSVAQLPGRITRVLIEPAPGREAALLGALKARYGATLDPRPVDTELKLLAGAAGAERQVTLLFSVISLVAGMILAYNALLLASAERRRFIVYLIETGAPESMVLASLGFDALILGLAGCALGLLAGDLTSLLAYGGLPGYIAAAFPVGPQRTITSQTVEIALAGGMFAALAATILPALSILRSGAVTQRDGMARTLSLTAKASASQGTTLAAGIALVGGSVLAALLAPAVTIEALVGLAAGIVLCLPLAARGLIALAHAASARSGDASARLSVAELRTSAPRTVALLATGAVAAFLMVVIGGSVSDVQSAVRRGAGDLLGSADLWVKPGGAQNVYTTEPFAYEKPQARLARLQRAGVVRSVTPWRDSFLDLPGRRVWVLGPPPALKAQIAPSQLREGSLALADERLREGGWVAISQTIAEERHVRVGGRISLPTPSGYVVFRIAATTANYGWLPGAIVMNGDEHARLWEGGAAGGKRPATSGATSGPTPTQAQPGGEATELAVTLAPGVSAQRGEQLVRAALGPGSGLAVQSTSERRAEVSAVLGSTLSRLNAITIVVIVTTIASVIALMMAAVWQGRARLHSLISIGMGFGQFARLIFYESGTVLLAGCAIGVSAGLVGQYLIDGWLSHTTGSPVHYAAAWLLGARTLAIALLISLAASLAAVVRINGSQPRAAFSTQ